MSDRPLSFEIYRESSRTKARRGRLRLRHGIVDTPIFMPVGTQAAVKSLDPRDLAEIQARIILSNAYHLMIRPGSKQVAARGGLHRFMRYDGNILTDSGGFQVFSLKELRRLSDDGVEFRSHLDGSLFKMTPESLVEVQEDLGPDIAMMLDECPPAQAPHDEVAIAVERTTRWAKRNVAARRREDMAWFGIVQGGLFEDLRQGHAEAMRELPFDGFAVGGVSVGENTEEITRIVKFTAPLLPRDKPRYLMGVGTPGDLVRGVAAGIDMFDCVMPTRNARNGQLFTSNGRIVIKNAEHRESEQPVDAQCSCYTCRTFSRAYLRHLYTAGEVGYHRLATLHNLSFYLNLMAKIRSELDMDTFDAERMLREMGPAAE